MKYYFYYYKRHSNLKIKVKLINGSTEISTGIKLKESEWNIKTKKIKCIHKVKLQNYYEKKLTELRFNLFEKNILNPTIQEFKDEFKKVTGRQKSNIRDATKFRYFTDWINHYKLKRKKLVKYETWRRVRMLLLHLRNFDSNLLSKDINFKTWIDFQHYLLTLERCYTDNYIRKICQEFKIYVESGIREGMPFEQFEYKFITKKHNKPAIWLEEKEVMNLAKVRTKSPEEKNCLYLFLFQCFTGFGYSEAINIRDENIHKDENGNIFIKIIRQKTGNHLTIPIPKLGYIFLKRKKEYSDISRQAVNRVIKRLCKRAKIDRSIEVIKYNNNSAIIDYKPLCDIVTTHIARKTFGRQFMKRHNNISALSHLYGHKNEETTRIYIGWENKELAKLVNNVWEIT